MHKIIPKPDPSIPHDEWNSYTIEQQEYAEFIYDVFNYFDVVVRDTLKWQPENIQINQGRSNIVLGFRHEHQRYLFRVPKFGQAQIKNYMRASSQVSHHDFFPERVYVDGRCMIERFAQGCELDEISNPASYIKLAHCLNKLHAQPALGYGGLMLDNQGEHQNIVDHYLQRGRDSWQTLSALFIDQPDIEQIAKDLWHDKLYSVTAAPVLCHGDLWHKNVLYDETTDQLKMIDWDTCGVYHREKDLHFLIDVQIDEACLQAFFAHYNSPIDLPLMSWFRLTMNLLYFQHDRLDHLLTALNHFMTMMGRPEQFNTDLTYKRLVSEKG